ncbi:MAG: DivIVA domain-containing protein [Gemmatimonadota bacterium]
MMDLTPLDVRKKKEDFRRTVRGYETGQVDAFLDLVAERLEGLVQKETSLSREVGRLNDELEAYRERERALNEALLSAQELREEARAQAERSAALKIREAESEAETIAREAELELRRAEERLVDLQGKRRRILQDLRATIARFQDELDEEEKRLEGVEEAGEERPGAEGA